MRLTREYFKQDALFLAEDLLGKLLCRKINGKVLKFRITETECYLGKGDSASHAGKKKTERNKIMFKQGGYAYVYLCYGIHYMFNIVSGQKNTAQGVLVRGVENFDGPGKLTKALKIDKSFNGADLVKSKEIWLENDGIKFSFKRAKRVGIEYAKKEDREKLWRFIAIK
ncbi:MAG: DNA-3-methyladenine glycosylase [Clostridia bacterium]|jgi:DNA-3-methyladenine glycosylase|nr:DNA-3-methyladenine glycosylase [Clostridia bacterium]